MNVYLSTDPGPLTLRMAKRDAAADGEVIACTKEQLDAYRAMETVSMDDRLVRLSDYQPDEDA